MGSGQNILIVEDEDEWCGIYQRTAISRGLDHTIKIASDLFAAERLIDATEFAVAFIDIGLDVSDDRNADGLRVMEKIRAMHDETSIVVVTGRSGQDVLSIARDSIKKYRAYDTVGKSAIRPSDIARLLEGGINAYLRSASRGRRDARDILRGSEIGVIWDQEIMESVRFKGDAGRFYEFLDNLVGDCLPLVGRLRDEASGVDRAMDVFYGDYWSRKIGVSVLVCFAAAEIFDRIVGDARTNANLLDRYRAEVPIKILARHGVKGAVFALPEQRALYG